ncbi:MAG TPA: GNAT family N-acetyltransferase [Micromonosporaceae bacterium]|nr:GNAT family N-acetyltransferase [Micromonosporaceae bacterium]
MRWRAEPDLATYARRVLPCLLVDPVRNNVACTLIQSRLDGMTPLEPDALWLHDNGPDGPTAVALRTPPRALLVTDMSKAAVDALADHLAPAELPGVNGPNMVADRFALRYASATGACAYPGKAFRMFRLDAVTAPTPLPAGRLREATPADRDLLVEWVDAFIREALPDDPPGDPAGPVDGRLARGGLLWVWEAGGEPVSTAYLTVPVVGVTRVSGVYTPPRLRGRGYASACVALMSQRALDAGALACMLYTDLSNPTSNKIYQAIGYRPVADTREWRFSRTG